jgi:hypothetical protein
VITSAGLHRAADRVWSEAGVPFMDEVAAQGAQFIRESLVTDEYEVPFELDTKSLGYGIMLGYLAAQEER